MSKGFQHPKTTIHVGDGFKFLEDYRTTFDVIITDSSDPEGPAQSLFHKSYFELLFGALKVRRAPSPSLVKHKIETQALTYI